MASGFDGAVSGVLVHLIKRMMASDPMTRYSVEDIWNHTVVRRIRLGEIDAVDVRRSMDSQSRSSMDDWEAWARRRGCGDAEMSPNATRIEAGMDVKPALVAEDPCFLLSILSGNL